MMIRFTKEVNTKPINITVLCLGDDLIASLSGGDIEHIGAAALAVPRASLADKNKISSTASVLCLRGHKEDETAKKIALHLAAELNANVLAVVGVHYNYAVPKMINNFEREIDSIIKEIIIHIKYDKVR